MTAFVFVDDVINHVILRQNFFGPILDYFILSRNLPESSVFNVSEKSL